MFDQLQFRPPELELVKIDWCGHAELKILRLDLLHPQLGGNKWFKIRPNLEAARKEGKHTVLSFGGAYSNHLRALSSAGRLFGFNVIGLVRGEIVIPLNPVLDFAVKQGMELVSVSRCNYRQKNTSTFLDQLRIVYGDPYIIPEGGSNLLGIRGCMEIANYLPQQEAGRTRVIVLASGTGATMAGLVVGLENKDFKRTRVIGISVLKAPGYLAGEVDAYIGKLTSEHKISNVSWEVIDDFHCGGYGKINFRLQKFMQAWEKACDVPIEAIYIGKMLLGVEQLCLKGVIEEGAEIVVIHTGGFY